MKPKVKGGSEALITGRRALDRAIKGTDYDNLDLIPADFSYRNMDLELGDAKKRTRRIDLLIRPLAASYDYVFLDCPPSISLVSENVFRAANVLLVPLIPTTLSLRTFDQLDGFLDDHPGRKKQKVMAFFSMVDNRKTLHRELVEKVTADRRDVPTTRSRRPATSSAWGCTDSRCPRRAEVALGQGLRRPLGRGRQPPLIEPTPSVGLRVGLGHGRRDGGTVDPTRRRRP